MNIFKRFFGPAALYGFASQLPKVVGLIVLPIISPYLTKNDFGVLAVIMAYTAIFSAFKNLGMPILLTNAFYKHSHRYQYFFRIVMGSLHLWYVPYYLVVAACISFICPEEARMNLGWIIAATCLPGLLLGPVNDIGNLLFQLKEQPQVPFFVTIITAFVSSAATIYLVVYCRLGYLGLIIGTAVTALISKVLFFYLLVIRKKFYPIVVIQYRYWKQKLGISLPMVFHYYSSYLLDSSDKMVMNQLTIPINSIGNYEVASKFSSVFNVGTVAINKAVSPIVMKAYKNKEPEVGHFYVELFQVLMYILTFSSVMIMPEVLPLVIRTEGAELAIGLTVPMVMAYNYRAMYVGSSTYLFYMEQSKQLLKVTFVAGISNVLANLVLMPIYGYEAAAWTTLLSFTYVGYAGYFIKGRRGVFEKEVPYIFYFICLFGLTALATFLISTGFAVRITAIIFNFIFWSTFYFVRLHKMNK